MARLKATKKACAAANWKLIGIELSRSQGAYPWKIAPASEDVSVVSVVKDTPLENMSSVALGFGLYRLLTKWDPDVVAIPGYYDLVWLVAVCWCRIHQKSAILMSESKQDDAPRTFWREKLKCIILKLYDSALVGGHPHSHYLRGLGMKPEQIFFGYDTVENERFHPKVIRTLPRPSNNSYFLAVNRFIPKKNLHKLVAAYAEYKMKAGESAWDLVLCGEGALRSDLEQHILELGVLHSVHLPGFLQLDELLPYFAHGECFVHASIQEQWGLVVNEAMASGLPVLVSNRCGCFEDLILEGVNGFGFDPEDQKQLTHLMLKVSSGEIDLKRMGQAALSHIQKFSPEHFAQGLIQAAEYALTTR